MAKVIRQNEVGPRSKAIVEQEARHMSPGLQSFAISAGLAMARGQGSRLFDEDGNSYIDFIAGIAVGSVGHCHPHYVARLKDQLERLTFGSFTTQVRAKFLDLLASLMPQGLTRIALFSGGAEAVEAAFRLAKSATGKHEFIGYTGAFHGKTGGVLPLLWGDFKEGLGPFVPDAMRRRTPTATAARCLDLSRLRHRLRRRDASGSPEADPRRRRGDRRRADAGNRRQRHSSSRFPAAIRQIAAEQGCLLIADEMITGFGRTGTMWGVDHDGVVPDVMTVGKGIGGGFPLSAIVSTDALTQHPPFSNPSGSSSSYGGNPLAAAAGLATLEIITREDLVANSRRVGAAMLARLEVMKEKHPVIGDVRGKGLLLGLELVKDRRTKELVTKAATESLFQECLRRGLAAMSYSPVIRINPPLSIDETTALDGLEILDEALSAVFCGQSPS